MPSNKGSCFDDSVDQWCHDNSIPNVPELPEELHNAVTAYHRNLGIEAMNAGYSGAYHDNGASAKLVALRWFLLGWIHHTPDNLLKVVKEARRLSDPEYPEYQRLKAKFE
jgi:hypothetical protein